jgi:hypothetical protein
MSKKLQLPFEECPHCGNNSGFYRRGTVSGGYIYYYNPDGTSGENTHLHDSIRYKDKKTAYCAECEKPLGTVDL